MPKEKEREEKTEEKSDAQDSENLSTTKSKGQDFVGLEKIAESQKDSENKKSVKEKIEQTTKPNESLTTQENFERSETNFEPIEIIENAQFHEFLQPLTESGSPVLERVATSQETIDLEQDFEFTQTSAEQTRSRRDYAATSNAPDYSIGEGERREEINYEPPILRPLNLSENLPRQELLNPLVDMRINSQNNTQPRRIESEFREESKRLPFETREERKYRRARF